MLWDEERTENQAGAVYGGGAGLQWSHATAVAGGGKLDIPTGISPIVGFKSASDEQRARIRSGKD